MIRIVSFVKNTSYSVPSSSRLNIFLSGIIAGPTTMRSSSLTTAKACIFSLSICSSFLCAHSTPASPPHANHISRPQPSPSSLSEFCLCLSNAAIRAIVSRLIASPFANWFALCLPTAVPQSPHPFSSAHLKATFAFSLACLG